MNKPTVYSRFNPPPRIMEAMNPHSKTETTGYIPDKLRIEKLLLSGALLNQHRKEVYDFNGTDIVPNDFLDPTRNSNFDMSDATRIARELESRHKEAEKRAKKAREIQEETRNIPNTLNPAPDPENN